MSDPNSADVLERLQSDLRRLLEDFKRLDREHTRAQSGLPPEK
jgi:hypothetical protein